MDVENSLEHLYFHAGSVRGVAFSPVVMYYSFVEISFRCVTMDWYKWEALRVERDCLTIIFYECVVE